MTRNFHKIYNGPYITYWNLSIFYNIAAGIRISTIFFLCEFLFSTVEVKKYYRVPMQHLTKKTKTRAKHHGY